MTLTHESQTSAHGDEDRAQRHVRPRHLLRLVTLNTFGVPFMAQTRTRLRTLARELNTANLDVACFQEVQLSPYVPLLRTEFRALPHSAYEPHVYAPKGGLLTLSRNPIRHSVFHPFKTRRFRLGPSLADWALFKGVLAVELAASAIPTIILNTHLVANYSGDWSPRNQYARMEWAQLEEVIELIGAYPPEALLIIAGDFNFPRGSWLYHDFLGATGLIDPMAEHNRPTYRPPRVLPAHYAQAIDFTFIRPPKDIRLQPRAQILFDEQVQLVNGRQGYVSDHHAIRLDILRL